MVPVEVTEYWLNPGGEPGAALMLIVAVPLVAPGQMSLMPFGGTAINPGCAGIKVYLIESWQPNCDK
jgi:hypothetical protein